MKLNSKDFTILKQNKKYHIFKDGMLIDIAHNIKGFSTAERASNWLNDFIASYNRKFENKNITLNEFCTFYLDNTKTDEEKLIFLLNSGILKSTDTYGNVIVSKLADFMIKNKTIINHLL